MKFAIFNVLNGKCLLHICTNQCTTSHCRLPLTAHLNFLRLNKIVHTQEQHYTFSCAKFSCSSLFPCFFLPFYLAPPSLRFTNFTVYNLLFVQLIPICIEFVFICVIRWCYRICRERAHISIIHTDSHSKLTQCAVSCNLYINKCVCVFCIDCAHLILVHLHIISNEHTHTREKT